MNKQHSLGSLANLAKILEEASNPESSLREDKKENKSKTTPLVRKTNVAKQARVIDAKRKFWYEKRLKEKTEQPVKVTTNPTINNVTSTHHLPSITKAVANKIGSNLLESLVNTKDAATKSKDNKNKIEAWRRKPGDPIF
jgi:hypothetical protein